MWAEAGTPVTKPFFFSFLFWYQCVNMGLFFFVFSYLKLGILTRESVATDTTFGAGHKCIFGICLFASFPPHTVV